jgi:hypothetical protein
MIVIVAPTAEILAAAARIIDKGKPALLVEIAPSEYLTSQAYPHPTPFTPSHL